MTDTVAVLIGTGSIGVAVARRAAIGHTLLLADYNQAQLATVADQLQGEGYDVETRVVDVSDRASVAALAEAAAALGDVVRVIHAAGVSPTQAPPERIVHVDLFGTAYVLDAFGSVIAEGGAGVVIASMAGHMGMVVVYKIDRLTRSHADCAKLVDRLDAASCSFVSVTQAFN
ncbi:MAG: SDR family NAD(P)-dependent oxidoreductase, partial [Propionibacteriaceae bacterium]|nr:SDR family NAD(P)-dependent oxidoreductase [Propionibacteriaceae bacterium]